MGSKGWRVTDELKQAYQDVIQDLDTKFKINSDREYLHASITLKTVLSKALTGEAQHQNRQT